MTDEKKTDAAQEGAQDPRQKLPHGIPPEMLSRMQPPGQQSTQRTLPHPAKCSLVDYMKARWELIKTQIPMSLAELIGINQPDVQNELSTLFANQYWEMRCSALEAGVQIALRRTAALQIALEEVVPEEDERNEILERAAKTAPRQFDKIPE